MLAGLTVLVLAFLVVPVALLVPVALSSASSLAFPPPGLSTRWFSAFAHSRDWFGSLAFSAELSVWVAVIATLLAIMAAFALIRGRVRGRRAVYALVLAPLIAPEITTVISLYFVFADLHLTGTPLAIVLGQSVLVLPIATILVSTTLQGFDVRLEQAALIHGASPLVAFRRVTLPLIAPGVATAALFAFLGSFDNLLVALFMGGPVHQTLPVRIWDFVQFELQPLIAAVSVAVTAIAVTVLVLGALLQRRAAARRGAAD